MHQGAFAEQDDLDAARALHSLNLSICEARLGADCPATIQSQENLAQGRGVWGPAVVKCARAADGQQPPLGKTDLATEESLSTVGYPSAYGGIHLCVFP
jgi:hypothetical protein